MVELEYPFDEKVILRKRKSIKKALVENRTQSAAVKIAVLSGSSINDIVDILELFLMNYGFNPTFYKGEYNRFYEESIFENKDLDDFNPDIVYIHSSIHNLKHFSERNMNDAFGRESTNDKIAKDYEVFEATWTALTEKYNCIIIQDNFEYSSERPFGNMDSSNACGELHYINLMNSKICEYAQMHSRFYISDVNYLSASYGLSRWSDKKTWYLYKYSLSMKAIPFLAFNISNIIKSLYGKNKKCIILDLDNT